MLKLLILIATFWTVYTKAANDNFNWVYAIKKTELPVMDGCLEDVCVKDKMFDVDYLRFVSIEGITYQGKFLLESAEGWSGYYMVSRKALAKTSGCSEHLLTKLCVGNLVKDLMGNKLAIIATHLDAKLVLRSIDGWNLYRSYVEPESITMMN